MDFSEHLDQLIARMKNLKRDADATPFFDLMSGAFVWSDERLSGLDVNTMGCQRFIFRYRTNLIAQEDDFRGKELWEELQRRYPEWIGFGPGRCTPHEELALRYWELRSQRKQKLAHLEKISIPKEPAGDSASIIYWIQDDLLVPALQVAPATISARFIEGEKQVTWYLKDSSRESILSIIPAHHFRSYLGHIGSHYMNGMVYGGEITRTISFQSQDFSTTFRMNNNLQNELFIEIQIKEAKASSDHP